MSFFDEPKIKTLSIPDFIGEIAKAIIEAYVTKGFNSNEQDVAEYAKQVCKFVKLEKMNLTVNDVKAGIKLGARGDFKKDNDLNIISPEMLITWIRRYDEQVRKDAVYELMRVQAIEEENRQSEKRIKGERDLIISISGYYVEYLQGKSLIEIFSFSPYPENAIENIYRFIDKLGLIEIDNDFKNLIFEESKKEILKEPLTQPNDIFQRFIESNSSFETRVITRARCKALKEQFDIWDVNNIKSIYNILKNRNDEGARL